MIGNQANNQIYVCIPSYKEVDLLSTLNSLEEANHDNIDAIVSIFINGSSEDDRVTFDTNLQSYAMISDWIDQYDGEMEVICELDLDLPKKHAGVGLARKLLADHAFDYFKEHQLDGVIVYLDADCTVQKNYFQEISEFFENTNYQAASIHYEHPIVDATRDSAIIEYESHLRYYNLMQQWTGFPFGIHTVGSSMAVRASAYKAKGGMNRRKAGEDFYFLQKFIKDQVCGRLTTTTVFPSGRSSNRVPFGTGRAMLTLQSDLEHWMSYNPKSFIELRKLILKVGEWYENTVSIQGIHPVVKEYLTSIDFVENVESIKNNTASKNQFVKRFYQFFDAFQLMKCLHYLREKGFPDLLISNCVKWYFENIIDQEYQDMYTSLLILRQIEKKN